MTFKDIQRHFGFSEAREMSWFRVGPRLDIDLGLQGCPGGVGEIVRAEEVGAAEKRAFVVFGDSKVHFFAFTPWRRCFAPIAELQGWQTIAAFSRADFPPRL